MERFFIKLKQISDVQDFVKIATSTPYPIDLHSGRYIVDGNSLLGIYSLDFTQKIEVVAHTDDASALKAALAKLIID